MQTYNVFYLVSGDDEENQNISDTATLSFDAEDFVAGLIHTIPERSACRDASHNVSAPPIDKPMTICVLL